MVSIEDFAEHIHQYIERQGPDFRLNFFVDEVGQYIADNIKLMTNLQTIAESLATKSRGRSWIIVTAQEDMHSVVGEMNRQQGEDFSKIQARFANRMKLTSADVAEVIQKRLLLKNDEGVEQLTGVYHAQSNNFKTLFDFADGSQAYRNFQNRDHFIHAYPFIPYQFTLFQSAIQYLSQHSAFEGRHSSVGERSMLGVFQQVVKLIAGQEVGRLATFDFMFEGIRTSLKSQIQRAILTGEAHLENPFAIRVLKALFLLKYVREFKATVRNICILMVDRFDQDLPALRKQVEEALNLLEQQTYIQRSGELYEFLTDEEKDIEQEIKNTDVESADVEEELGKIIFDHVIKNRKIRYEDNGQDYPFSRKLDDHLVGREYELAIHAVSPFHEHAGNHETLQMQSIGRSELLVAMTPDDRLVRDMLMYKRTEKYIRQNVSVTQQDSVKQLLTAKSFQNRERLAEIQQRVQGLLGKSRLFVAGDEIEVPGEDTQSRIFRGFHELVLRVYPNLRMLRGVGYTENDVAVCLDQASEGLFGNDATTVSEAEQEMLAMIQGNNRGGVRTTLKSLIENFERKPYGWYLAAILCTLAKLYARGKVEVRSDGNILENAELERALRNTHGYSNVVLEPQIDFTASQVRHLKEFFEEFFDEPPPAGEAKALGRETAAAFKEQLLALTPLAEQTARYPFLTALQQPLQIIRDQSGKPYTYYLTELGGQEDALLDLKEKVLDPVRRFMSGAMKDLYDEARTFLQSQEPNFAYVEGDEVSRIREILEDEGCYKNSRMQQVRTLVDTVKDGITQRLQQEKEKAEASVAELNQRLSGMADFAALSAERQQELAAPFDRFIRELEAQTLIAVIRDTLRRFEETEYPRLVQKMDGWIRPEPDTETSTGTGDDPPPPKIEYVSSRSIPVAFDKATLADEKDVDHYIAALKQALMKEIGDGKRIQI